MASIEHEFGDEDPDFNDSDYDVYDDDDCLFDRTVTECIEMGMRIVEHEEGQEVNSSSYASSEELNFLSGSDSEGNRGRPNYPEYFADGVKRNPQLEVGLLFANFEELKSVVRDYAVFNPRPWYVASAGRKQKKRRKGPDEDGQSQSQTHSQSQSQVKRKGVVYMTCSVCGEKGHNKRHHKFMEPQVHGS